MTNIVLIYADSRDPLIPLLTSIEGLKLLHVDQISRSLKREQWPGLYRCAMDLSEYRFHNSLIFNRVFGLENSEAMSLLKANRLHEGWLHHCIDQITKPAAKRVHDIGQRGVSRTLLPLNIQWYLLAQALPEIRTPAFALGFNGAMPDLSALHPPILKSIWSFSAWKNETYMTELESRWNRFFVEAPMGLPVIVSFAGDKYQLHFPKGITEVSLEAIQQLVTTCRCEFKTDIGEIITFVKGDELTFCAYSPYVGFSASSPEFQDALIAYCKTTTSLCDAAQLAYDSI